MINAMNILVIGTGAVGSFYGALLARSGARVSLLARSDYRHIANHGISISSTQFGQWHFAPHAVIRHGSELTEPPDYVLLCVKWIAGADRIGLIRDTVGPKTTIVLLANGVAIEDEIHRAFPDHELISGLAFTCITRTAPGQILHQAYGRVVLGHFPQGVSISTLRLTDALAQSGIDATATEHIITARWQKCVWNAPFNPLSVLSGGLTTAEILGLQENLVREIMREICLIADALGHTLPSDIIDQQIDSTQIMPPYKTSMLLDYEAGRPMETEAIVGNAVRSGRRVGLPIPYLESLYALLKLTEWRLTQAN